MAKNPEVDHDISLSPEERAGLIENIVEASDSWMPQLSGAGNWNEAKGYMPLVGLMGVLQDPTVTSGQLEHARRMIAHDYISLPKDETKPRNTDAFLKAVRQEAGAEIKQARGFKGDSDMMPAAYYDALLDLESLKERMTLDPSILRLAATLRQVRQTGKL